MKNLISISVFINIPESYDNYEPKKGGLKMLITYVPNSHVESVRTALFAQGAGSIGEYSECHFSVDGVGTFKGSDNSNPAIGQKGNRESVSEQRIELVFPSYIESKVISTLKTIHPYEEVAYSVLSLNNKNENVTVFFFSCVCVSSGKGML